MVTEWHVTPVHTDPANSTMAAGQVKLYSYDATLDLGVGQVPSVATVELVRLDTGAVVTGGATLITPAISGNIISMRVTGVEAGVTYELRIAFTHSNPRVTGEKSVRLHIIEGAE